MERVQAPALDVHKPSPVRGQLEPWDPRTPKGARYIQCTDTCDELKVRSSCLLLYVKSMMISQVLLPPGTAGMYEQLLKLESYELSKKTNLSWARIMEIRHLKDRMIRKCQKLVKTELPTARTAGLNFVFQTLAAPADFRLKEMEKWFREQQKKTKPTSGYTSGQGYTSGREMSLPANTTLVRIPTPAAKPIPRAITAPEPPAQPKPVNYVPPIRIPHRIQQHERKTSATMPSAVSEVFSPPPLPVLLLSQREDYGLETYKPALARETEAFKEKEPPEPAAADPPPNPVEVLSPNPGEGEATVRPGALARRSSYAKRVSWADSQDILDKQVTQYANAARDAQSSGERASASSVGHADIRIV